jgi:excisionase family DNA binding protein
MSDINTERWITLDEAAAYLQVSKSFLYQKGGLLGIPRAKVGTKYRYKRSELDAWVKGQVRANNA